MAHTGHAPPGLAAPRPPPGTLPCLQSSRSAPAPTRSPVGGPVELRVHDGWVHASPVGGGSQVVLVDTVLQAVGDAAWQVQQREERQCHVTRLRPGTQWGTAAAGTSCGVPAAGPPSLLLSSPYVWTWSPCSSETPPPGPSSALSSLVAPTSARPMDFGEQQRPSPVYKHSQAFKRGVRKHTCESPQVTVSRHPERDARAGPRAKWGAALREPGADLHIRGMTRCGPRQLGRPAARPREEAQVPPATLTCDGSPDFPGCLLPHLDGCLLAVPGRVRGADQVGCVLQRALAKATDGTEQVRVGWRVSDPAWNHTPPPRQTRRP